MKLEKLKTLDTFEIPALKKGPWTFDVPTSKSLTNRAVHLASLAKGRSFIWKPLDCLDTRVMIRAQRTLGAQIWERKDHLEIEGHGGNFTPLNWGETLHISNAGTAARFITAALSVSDYSYEMHGDEPMEFRPLCGLTKPFGELGVQFDFLKRDHAVPYRVSGKSEIRKNPASLKIPGEKSSQFLSAFMMVGPLFESGLTLSHCPEMVSLPYVMMTKKLMEHFGALIEEREGAFHITGKSYKKASYYVEVDYSSASYFLVLAAIHGEEVFIPGAKKESLQGDVEIVSLLEKMGCRVVWKKEGLSLKGPKELLPLDADLKGATDLVPALAIAALFAKGKSRLRRVEHMKYKECDRVEALEKELSALGAKVYEVCGDLIIEPQRNYQPALLATYEDHRMAMAFTVAGTKISGLKIENPACVEKTFPNFFELLDVYFSNSSK